MERPTQADLRTQRGRRGWDGGREQHGNMYITICKIDGQRESALGPGSSNQGSVNKLEGWDGWEERGRFKWREHMYTYVYIAPHILKYGRNQHNIVKQLSSN